MSLSQRFTHCVVHSQVIHFSHLLSVCVSGALSRLPSSNSSTDLPHLPAAPPAAIPPPLPAVPISKNCAANHSNPPTPAAASRERASSEHGSARGVAHCRLAPPLALPLALPTASSTVASFRCLSHSLSFAPLCSAAVVCCVGVCYVCNEPVLITQKRIKGEKGYAHEACMTQTGNAAQLPATPPGAAYAKTNRRHAASKSFSLCLSLSRVLSHCLSY